MTKVCDKCGQSVEYKDDAMTLDIVLRALLAPGSATPATFLVPPRHLFPTANCPGSPSRAQYLKGQPRDSRPEYAYDERIEPFVREAYSKMQEFSRAFSDIDKERRDGA